MPVQTALCRTTLAWVLLEGLLSTAWPQPGRTSLKPGETVERELAGSQSHFYDVTLSPGQYLQLVVNQLGIDIVVSLLGPEGQKIIEVDSESSVQGSERLSYISELGGDYQLKVRSADTSAPPGRYTLELEELRFATASDRDRVDAEAACMAAGQLRSQGTAESLRQAIGGYEQALRLFRKVEGRQREAETLDILGQICDDLGETEKALDYFHTALPLWKAVRDRAGEAKTLYNMGVLHQARGEPQEAMAYYDQTLPLQQATGDRLNEAITLNNLGEIYYSRGEIQKGLNLLNQAQALSHEMRDPMGEGAALFNIGWLYQYLGDKQTALDYFNRTLPLRRAANDQGGEAHTLSGLGAVCESLGELEKALDYNNQALLLFRATGDRINEAHALNRTGRLFQTMGETRKALECYSQALTLSQLTGNRRAEARTLHHAGLANHSMGEKQSALEQYSQALLLSRAVKDSPLEALTLQDMARVERDLNRLAEARTHSEQALGIAEAWRASVTSQESRTSFFSSVQNRYEFHTDLMMRMHREDPAQGYAAKALQATEQARARSLLELLSEAHADIRERVDPTLLERERSLGAALDAKTEYQIRLLSGKPDKGKVAVTEREVQALTADYREVQAQIRATSPRYAALTQPRPLTLAEIQRQVLDPDTLLLEYALGDEHSFLWAVTPSELGSFELPRRAVLEAAARGVYAWWSTNSSMSEEELKKVVALSQMLLGPVAGQLGKKRLVVVADGALQYVPFGALPTPEGKGERDKVEGRSVTPSSSAFPFVPLIVDHEIVSLPSASTLAVLRQEMAGRHPAPKTVAVMADPVFDKTDPRVRSDAAPARQTASEDVVLERSAKESGLTGFDRLLSTRREAEEILRLARDGSSLKALDFQANRTLATSPELAQHQIIHFATHALLNPRHPELSGIVLSLVDEKGQPQNGFLQAHEVYNLRLNADLVVLSACQTALGKEIKGEGLVGLTRGFMYAGAPRVVASLWRVPDKATAELMKHFYHGMLVDGLRPAAALRVAQVEVRKEKRWSAPYYWAAFTLQGEWN